MRSAAPASARPTTRTIRSAPGAKRKAAQRELVPVGKAYFGFTDAELLEIDRWIRNNTVESFGPVRAVAPKLVFEVAFDAVQALYAAQVRRCDALPAHPPHPLG